MDGRKFNSGKVKHGHKRVGKATPEYKTWLGMKARCYREKNKDYPNWGGRGIKVCARWLNDFSAFLEDMGCKPTSHHSIDRIDPNLDYSPDNCRWATQKQQGGENKRSNISVTIDGITFTTIADACRYFGVLPTTVNERLKAGIPIQDAFKKGRLKSRRTVESYWRKSAR